MNFNPVDPKLNILYKDLMETIRFHVEKSHLHIADVHIYPRYTRITCHVCELDGTYKGKKKTFEFSNNYNK